MIRVVPYTAPQLWRAVGERWQVLSAEVRVRVAMNGEVCLASNEARVIGDKVLIEPRILHASHFTGNRPHRGRPEGRTNRQGIRNPETPLTLRIVAILCSKNER